MGKFFDVVQAALNVQDKASNDKDLAAMKEYLTYISDDIAYQNKPQPQVSGKEQFKAFSKELRACTQMECKILRHAETDAGWVFTQRQDNWTINGIRVWMDICGVFEIVDGKIKTWFDYVPENHSWPETGQLDVGFFARWPMLSPRCETVSQQQ